MSEDDEWLLGVRETLRPPPKLSLSAWADKHFVLSSETAAQPGRWRTLAWQREVMDAITNDAVERVTVMKAARVGYTSLLSTAIGYFMAADPTTILVVQPTVDDAKGFSKEVIASMLRDVPTLARISIRDDEDASETLTHKSFPGGILSLVGANSGTGFRRVSRRIVMFDEVDGYPASAGVEGDPIKLGERRSEHYWNRKIIAGSTPLVAGASRIEELFLSGDQRRFYLPCPHCGAMDILSFDRNATRGHVMHWPENEPEAACFDCSECGCAIEETHKRSMLERGEWRADNPGGSHRSFHIWTAYSTSPNATWGQIAAEFLEAKQRPETLRTFVNTVLGDTWKERGEAPEWQRLYDRRETYAIGTVPVDVLALTAGVDVQKDRFVYEVVAWNGQKESWSIDAGLIFGDTAADATWAKLDELLDREYPGVGDHEHRIAMLAVDSGYNTQQVYSWARRHPMNRVIATKGTSGAARALVSPPSAVDVTTAGRTSRRGYKVWLVGTDIAKSELYGWLRLRIEDNVAPPGYCHFPEHDEEFFKQLTAEHLVSVTNRRTGRARMEWHTLPSRENHWLDARILARVAAAVLGIDRLSAKQKPVAPARTPPAQVVAPAPAPRSAPSALREPRSSFWNNNRPGGWFGRGR